MRDFLLCCFAKSPEDRPGAAELKEHPWIEKHKKATSVRSQAVAGTEEQMGESSSICPTDRSPPACLEMKYTISSLDISAIENEKNLHYPRIYYNIMPDEHQPKACVAESTGSPSSHGYDTEKETDDGAHVFTLTSFGKGKKNLFEISQDQCVLVRSIFDFRRPVQSLRGSRRGHGSVLRRFI